MTKWVVVTGGVLSGLGKGVVTSSIGLLLKSQGFKVSAVKIDPYLNMDAGTLRPTEHGEVFVTFDGGETDQDLGNYERFLDVELSRSANITSGQVFKAVIDKERNLFYGGSDVQVMRDIPREIISRLESQASSTGADFVLVEVGGTVGDYENVLFLQALKQMKTRGEDMVFVHVSYLPVLANVGEMKTKPTQHSVKELNAQGIFPDFLVARGKALIDDPRKDKIATFCGVPLKRIIAAPDVDNIYEVPVILESQGFARELLSLFGHSWVDSPDWLSWKSFVSSVKSFSEEVVVGIVGKYFDIGDYVLEDSYISVIEAVKAAAFANKVSPRIVWINSKDLESYDSVANVLSGVDAVIVPGGFGSNGVEGKINAIRFCREHKKPFLGLCYGLQLAVVEFARNVLGLKGANSTEIDPDTPYPVVLVLPEQAELLRKKQYGNSMRLGDYEAVLKDGSLVARLYSSVNVVERHRHRYEVNPDFVSKLESGGLVFSGTSPDGSLMEFLELPDHPFFVATQAHPEFKSRPLRPHPLFFGLLNVAKNGSLSLSSVKNSLKVVNPS